MRVNGPYQHRARWRLVVVSPDGTRDVRSFDNERDAEEAARAFRKLFGGAPPRKTIGDALTEYEVHQRRSTKGATTATTIHRLTAFVGDQRDCDCARVGSLAARYAELTERWAVSTHRGALSELRTFGAWLVKRGYARHNLADGIEAVGVAKRRKPQLRIDEARAWMAAALELAPREPGAVAALCTLLMGLRASEVTERVVRDLDDAGRVLVIEDAKTPSGTRRVAVPDVLQVRLLALTKDKLPTARLFGRHWRDWPREWVQRICEAAGVPRVTAQGMRGLHATLAIGVGASPQVVAGSLGHSSSTVTLRSYALPTAKEAADGARVLTALGARG